MRSMGKMLIKEISCIVANVCFVGAIISSGNFINWLLLTCLGMVWFIIFIKEEFKRGRR